MKSLPHQAFIQKGPAEGEEENPRYYSVLILLDVFSRMADGKMFVRKHAERTIDDKAKAKRQSLYDELNKHGFGQ